MSEDQEEESQFRDVSPHRPPGSVHSLGRFTIERELGRGGAGIVYLAEDSKLRRKVAVKVPRSDISEDMYQRFLREARAAAALKHPSIVPILEVGEAPTFAFIVYEYCPGRSLEEYIKARGGPVDPAEAAELIAKLAEALAASHQSGIIHRDLKPANILLDDSPTPLANPRITDFGLAKIFEAAEDDTQSGVLIGTPAYMSPEQARGDREQIGPGSDQFALGILLYELISGDRPFKGGTFMQTVDAVQRCQPVPLRKLRPETSPDLDRICMRCLRKDPSQRFESTELLAEDLRRHLRGEPILTKPATFLDHVFEAVHPREIVARSAIFSACAMGVLGIWCLMALISTILGLIRFRDSRAIAIYGITQLVVFYGPIVTFSVAAWRTNSLRYLQLACGFQLLQLSGFVLMPILGWTPMDEMEGDSSAVTNMFFLIYICLNGVNLCFALWIHPDRKRRPR